jgi:hypothetical protein
MKQQIEQQAEYADHICRQMVAQNHKQVDEMEVATTGFSNWNSTSIGNTAYIVLNAKNSQSRQNAQQSLKNYTDWYNNR